MIVMDGGSFYANVDFSLVRLIEQLESPKPWYRVQIEPRYLELTDRPVANADLAKEQFVRDRAVALFDANELIDLNDTLLVDQVWFFGIQRMGPLGRPLSSAELTTVARFMNAGGGVFATGDHQSMGYKMCGAIPRVRSMRRWWYLEIGKAVDAESTVDIYADDGTPQPHVPAGIRPAPSLAGRLRHDTLVTPPGGGPDVNGDWNFDWQGDATPQVVWPVFATTNTSRWAEVRSVHPLMCGPAGAVTHLPDHAHEGDCSLPQDLTLPLLPAAVHPASALLAEYPQGGDGNRPEPVVVAWATVQGSHGTTHGKLPTPATYNFPVISAYDGFEAGVGRVVCDATWHHFFYVNVANADFTTAMERRASLLEQHRTVASTGNSSTGATHGARRCGTAGGRRRQSRTLRWPHRRRLCRPMHDHRSPFRPNEDLVSRLSMAFVGRVDLRTA